MTACGERHTSARTRQSAASSPNGAGVSPVRSSSAITMSTRVSNGSPPRAAATSPTLRPVASSFSGAKVSTMINRSQFARPRSMPASFDWAPWFSRRRTSGSASAANRSGTGRCMMSRHPGSPSSTKPVRNDSRIFMACGRVSATTLPPRSAATSEARSCFSCPAGFAAETPSRFQFSGRSAATDMSVSKAISSSVKPCRQPGIIASSVVPGCSRTPVASASSSSRDALRDGTGWPEPSLWVGDCDVENPSAPSAKASCSSATIRSTCAGLA